MNTESDNQRLAILANAKMVQELAREQMGTDLAFDGESVEWLDGYIEEIREQYDVAAKDRLISVFGFFFGEALIQSYGGEWQQYEGAWCVRFVKEQKAFPFAKVAKQFENGSVDSIYQFFVIVPIVMKLSNDPDFKQANQTD